MCGMQGAKCFVVAVIGRMPQDPPFVECKAMPEGIPGYRRCLNTGFVL